jgi:hypothetical protein
MHRLLLTASTLALFLASTPISAQDEWEEQARTQLLELARVAGLDGYELKQKILTGGLRQRRFINHPVTLDAGIDYAFVATCDSDCVDVDLRLYSGSAVEIDSDVERDDYPVVEVSPPRTRLYQVRVIMAQCASNPCRYGIGIFEKQRVD